MYLGSVYAGVVRFDPSLCDERSFRVFVGTMFVEENEVQASIASIRRQRGVEIYHTIVRGKNELDAHRELYARWNQSKQTMGVFVKVDADTVITHDDALLTICEYLTCASKVGYNAVQCPLYDWFTDATMLGVSTYHRSVEFTEPRDPLFCDMYCIENVATAHQDGLPTNLNPIGIHCSNPSFRQAFRYGLHRGLKGYDHQRRQVVEAYERLGDDRRLMAIRGFEAASMFLSRERCSYVDPEFEDAYLKACGSEDMLIQVNERYNVDHG